MDFLHQYYSNPAELGCSPAPEPGETHNNTSYDREEKDIWENQTGTNARGVTGTNPGRR
jgi:hypothetical protein